jgi:hypothetical protein
VRRAVTDIGFAQVHDDELESARAARGGGTSSRFKDAGESRVLRFPCGSLEDDGRVMGEVLQD